MKLTVLLTVVLVPSDVLRGAEDSSWLGHSPRSPLGRRWSCGLWSDVDFETASDCKNITEAVKLVDPYVCACVAERARTGRAQRWPGEKENKRLRSTAGKVKSPL